MLSRCLGFLLLLSPLQGALPPSPFNERLLRDEAFWGDGKAEYTIFDARENRYGALRDTEVRHILVREDFAADAQVKADNWQAPGTYRYDQGHSSFWRARDGELIKFAQTTNDSCGLTYKQGNRAADEWRYRAFTYWEGSSEVDRTISPPGNTLFYDELPFRLRLINFGRVTMFEAPLIPSVIGSRADRLLAPPAVFAVEKTPKGWRVTVKHAQGTDQLTFDEASPHALREWTRWDGSSLIRRSLVRIPYWELNQPGDEKHLREET